MALTHECPAKDCKVRVVQNRLACAKHWFKIPLSIRSEIWEAYQMHGQGSPEHTAAIAKGIEALQ